MQEIPKGTDQFTTRDLRHFADAALPDSRAAEKARVIARDVIEYLDSIDFNKYYESLQKPSARSGEAKKMFLDFSLSSIRAAKVYMYQGLLVKSLHCIYCCFILITL